MEMSNKADTERSPFDYRGIRETACGATAGAAAGVIAGTFVCPLEVIKTRLQVIGLPLTPLSGRQKGSVIIRSLQDIVKNEGVRGMYRGLSPTSIALLPNWAIYFSVYEKLKDVLKSNDDKLSVGANIVASGIAGVSTAVATNPLWVIRTRLMTQGMRKDVVPYNTVLSAFTRIFHQEGLRGLYSGLVPSLIGVSHVVIQLPAYEKIKQYMAEIGNKSVDKLSPESFAVASSISKVIASVMTYPHEVIRSKLQEQGQMKNTEVEYSGVMDCIKKVYRKEGVIGFYRGCATNLLRTTPAAIITFTSYEMINGYLLQQVLKNETQHKSEEEEKDLS